MSYMAVQGNHEGREVIVKDGIAIGVSGSQRVGKLEDKVGTRLEAKERSEVDHLSQGRIRTTRGKSAHEGAMLNGHLRHRIEILLISCKVVVEVEVEETVVADPTKQGGKCSYIFSKLIIYPSFITLGSRKLMNLIGSCTNRI